MEYVKICGLNSLEHVELCAQEGADAVGFIYDVPSSPRNLEKDQLASLLDKINEDMLTVVVTKPRTVADIKKFMEEIKVDLYQIHGCLENGDLETISDEFKAKIIMALKLDSKNLAKVIETIEKYKEQVFAFLIDNSEGKGNQMNLRSVKELLKQTKDARIILAGGIGMDNVEDVVMSLKPYGIDVSSSLESERGVKDPIKISQFMKKIRELQLKLVE